MVHWQLLESQPFVAIDTVEHSVLPIIETHWNETSPSNRYGRFFTKPGQFLGVFEWGEHYQLHAAATTDALFVDIEAKLGLALDRL